MMFLLKSRGGTSIQIAERMGLDRTTVQKALKGLLDKNLARRAQNNLPGGGYVFLYKIEDKESLKSRLKDIIYGWYKSVEREIEGW